MASKSPERVQRLISCTQKPLVFHGLIDSWPMLKFTQSDWNNLFGETLLECRVGNRGLNGDLPQWEGRCENIKCTFSQLIKWSNHRDDGTNAELSDLEANNHFLYYGYKYMKDIFETEVLRMTDWKAFGYPDRNGAESTFWLGTAGAHTPCHYDTYGCNLVAQLSGRKRWILYSPDETEFLKPTRVPYEESSVYSQINFEQWSNTAPIIEGTHPYVVELSPGDVLFVPRHWWHYVRNEELSISINTWLELPDQDSEARLHESLVKFLVAHTTRNLPPNVVSDLLNPNEEDVAYVDLEEVDGLVRYSISALRDVHVRSINTTQEKSAEPIPNETWVTPVVCQHSLSSDIEPEKKRARSNDVPPKVNTVDVIRAFCHPRVIETVSRILQDEFSLSNSV